MTAQEPAAFGQLAGAVPTLAQQIHDAAARGDAEARCREVDTTW